jgi:Caspase domain
MPDSPDLVHHEAGTLPGTHALVIGVGEYPHLIGGDDPAQKTDGLRQLSSPPVSARAFAEWLLRDYRCPGKELASLSLLVSETESVPFVNPRTGAAHDVPTAGTAEIVAAVRAWKRRADTSADNRTIFYFCGHGTSEGGDMALLTREFSLDDDNPLDSALDFRKLVEGLRDCRAVEQLFFVDACRAGSDVLISQTGGAFAGQVPVLGRLRPLDLPRREPFVYYATLAGDMAYARPESVSLFTAAMLRALDGAGSDDNEGPWQVSTTGLHAAVTHFLNEPRFAGAVAGVQVPAVGELPVFPVHHLIDLPVVPVYVGCLPPESNGQAEFVCRQAGQEPPLLRRTLAEIDPDDPTSQWLVDLRYGDYEFEARIAPDEVRLRSLQVRPQYRRVQLSRP